MTETLFGRFRSRAIEAANSTEMQSEHSASGLGSVPARRSIDAGRFASRTRPAVPGGTRRDFFGDRIATDPRHDAALSA